MENETMTPGEFAYTEDVRRRPKYHTGQLRPSWKELDFHVKISWEKNPKPRDWPVSFTDISTITEYGLTQKLSNVIRVF